MSSQSQFPGAIPPPPGVTPDLNARNTERPAILAAVIVMLVIPSLLVPMRLFVKVRLLREFKPADAFCLIGWCLIVTMCGLALSLLRDGMGLHAWDVSPLNFSRFLEYNNIHQIVYVPAIFFAKVSILLQFGDIFVTQKRNARWWIIWGLIVFNFVFLTIVFFIIIFECNPRRKIWEPELAGSCVQEQTMFIASSVINILDDFVILILPIFWILKLQIDAKKKIGVTAIFAAGLFACIASIIRLVESVKTFNTEDLSYKLLPVALWAMAEVASALVVGCLPVLPRLFRRSPNKSSVGPSKYSNYMLSRDPKPMSSNNYVEMSDDDVLLNGGSLNSTTVSSQPHRPVDMTQTGSETGNDSPPNETAAVAADAGIYRTISVKQESNSAVDLEK